MRKMIALIALAVVGGGLLFWSMSYTQGFIMIAIGNQVVQLSLWMAVLVLLSVWLAFRVLVWAIRGITRPGAKIWSQRKLSRVENNRRQLAQGLERFYEGRWREAKQALMKSAAGSNAPVLNYLVAAEAAAELGDHQEAEEILSTAAMEVGDNNIALALARARVLIRRGDDGRAASVLRKLQLTQPRHPYVLRLLKGVLLKLQDWESLATLLPDLRRSKAEPEAVLDQLEIEVRRGALRHFLEADSSDQSVAQRLETLVQLWSSTPKIVRKNSELVGLYSEALESVGDHKHAEAELRRQINREWDGALVLKWADLETSLMAKKITIAEAWLRQRNNSPELLLALGRICRRSELWGKAKDYLERAVAVDGSAQAYGELAAVMEYLGERSKSEEYYQAGLKSSLKLA